jgi:competence protein CoiA
MLTSIRQNDNQKVYVKDVDKNDAPFKCPSCGCESVLRKGLVKAHHFAHKPPIAILNQKQLGSTITCNK